MNEVFLAPLVRTVMRVPLAALVSRASEAYWVELVPLVRPGLLVILVREGCKELAFSTIAITTMI